MRRITALTTAGLATLLASGCSLPSKERWAQINERGLIPVLIDGRNSTATASAGSGAVKPSEEHAVRVQPVSTPVIVRTPSADRIPGRTGYVYSPYAQGRQVVDVRGFQPGEEVRDPYTGKPFLVPSIPSDVVVSRPRREAPVTEVVSNSNSVPDLDPALNRLEPVESPTPPAPRTPAPETPTVGATPTPAPAPPVHTPAPSTSASNPKADIPYGTRVAGRPGFVYSPFAAKSQLVDVAGTAPGVVVKCPYTNKLFRVPEVVGEEVKPSASSTAEAPAPPAPSTPVPTPAPASSEPAPSTPSTPSTLGTQPR